MAELKSLGRQISQPGAPDITAAAQAEGALGGVISGVSKVVGKHVENQRKAALELENSFNVLSGQRELNLHLLKAKENPFPTTESVAEFNKTQQEIMNNILKNTSPENLGDVSVRLQAAANKNELDMVEHVQSAGRKALKDTAATLLYEESKQLQQYAVEGDEPALDASYLRIDQSRRELVKSGNLSEADYLKGRDELFQSALNGRLEYEYNKSVEEGGEVGGAKFINEFWNKEYEGMTQDQKNQGLKHLMDVAARDKAAQSRASYLGYNDVLDKLNSTDAPKSENEVHALIEKANEDGLPLNEWQAHKALQKYRTLNSKRLQREKDTIDFNSLVASGDVNGLIALGDTKVNNAYVDTKKALVERAQQQTEAAASDAQRVMAQKPAWLIGATIAAEVPVPIGQWQEEIHSQLMSANNEDVLNAAKGYNYVKSKNKAAVDGISAKDKAFMDSVVRDIETTTMEPTDIVQRYREAILEVTPQVEENRLIAYKENIKNNPSLPNKIVKQAFGEKVKNVLKEPGAQLYAVAQEQYQKEFMLTGDQSQAIKNAVQYLKDNGGESKFGPKNEPVWNPPEHLPFYETGNIVRNQASKFLDEAIKNSEQFPGALPYTIERSEKMPEFPEKLTEKDLYDGKYDKGEWWLKIDGKDRRVYFISPNYNQANAFPSTQYQVMFEKDGRLQNLMIAVPKTDASGKAQYSARNAMMIFYAPNDIIPNLLKKMQDETADSALTKGAAREYDKKHLMEDIRLDSWIFNKNPIKEQTKKEAVEQRKHTILEEIEKQKLRRQEQETKEYLEGQGEGP